MLTRNIRRQGTWWIAGLACWMASAAIGRGEVGSVVTFPQPATRMRSGVTVQVDARGVSANGYRTIRVKVSNTPTRNRPAVPVTADRRFRIVIKPWGRGHLANVVTSQIIEIPEKQSAAEAAIAIPFSGQWNSLEINVFESGSHLADVSGHHLILPQSVCFLNHLVA